MKLSALLPPLCLLADGASGFSLSMNAGSDRSKLANQYKNIMSIHSNNIRMAPPGEPEPEVSV